jgi:hypothetical protein
MRPEPLVSRGGDEADLVIRGARAFDPRAGLDEVRDIVVRGGGIAELAAAEAAEAPEGAEEVGGDGLLALPALLSAPGALIDNVKILASYPGADTELAVNASVMPNWRGFILSLTNSNSMLLWLPGHALIAFGAIVAAFVCWRNARNLDKAYAIAATLPLVVSPHLHTQSLVLLLLPGAIITILTHSEIAAIISAVLCLFPLVYLTVAAGYSFPLIIDRELGAMESLLLSCKTVHRQWFPVFGLLIVIGLIMAAGILACCVGVVFTAPLAYLIWAQAYRQLFGDR